MRGNAILFILGNSKKKNCGSSYEAPFQLFRIFEKDNK